MASRQERGPTATRRRSTAPKPGRARLAADDGAAVIAQLYVALTLMMVLTFFITAAVAVFGRGALMAAAAAGARAGSAAGQLEDNVARCERAGAAVIETLAGGAGRDGSLTLRCRVSGDSMVADATGSFSVFAFGIWRQITFQVSAKSHSEAGLANP